MKVYPVPDESREDLAVALDHVAAGARELIGSGEDRSGINAQCLQRLSTPYLERLGALDRLTADPGGIAHGPELTVLRAATLRAFHRYRRTDQALARRLMGLHLQISEADGSSEGHRAEMRASMLESLSRAGASAGGIAARPSPPR